MYCKAQLFLKILYFHITVVPEERAGVVQSNVEHSVLPHTLPVYRATKNFIHHLETDRGYTLRDL